MNLVRRAGTPLPAYRPGSFKDGFARLVDNMFQDFFAPLAQGGNAMDGSTGMPRLDMTESEQAYDIQAEMPGVDKEDLKVAIDGTRVTIEGECRKANERREGENVVYSERSARKYVRSFTLPTEIDDTAAQARLENGVLHLTLPKKQGKGARRLEIH
ncbi:Hsp20/alpha crystallin family protein [Massilia sp. Dwa41.01b]|uniref:Hsp20/alpha crystallin family protein n=1 Tax=unclassified Massilia TaxID=2609279 RepID=UPI001602AC22|nr:MULTISPECIES: Hsp20/alpha crystallin family protein [unclassified Massilia]QNA89468.1 Hsp20/alpha crystallin family protein [Massilia sp. Dwa41.01b]QNB00373.1 Hsp20/alpha crystallin family protein [Massilia sp. Se16.2.3]